jgi:hypothetical protein
VPNPRNNPPNATAQTNEPDRPGGCLLRLFWMAFGNLALFMVAVVIIGRRAFSVLDGAYWLIVVALLAARYADIAVFAGRTTEGAPASMQHFRQYAFRLLIIAALSWGGAHLLGRAL